MKRFITVLILFCLITAQSVKAQSEKADREFEELNYSTALELYKKIYDSKKDLHALKRIVECYKKMNAYKEWELWGQKFANASNKTNPDALLLYGEALMRNGKYREAKQAFYLYGRYSNGKLFEAQFLEASCDSAIDIINNSRIKASVKNLEILNTHYSEWGLVPYRGGFVFSSDRPWESKTTDMKAKNIYGWTGRPYLKIFYVENNPKTDVWGTPSLFSDFFNGEFHTAGPTFNSRENSVFFTRTRSISLPETDHKPIIRLEIFSSDAWKEAKPFKYNNVTKYSVGDPAITGDGKRLYFVSDMPGGYGGTDIYYCDLDENGEWGPVKNAGPEINTKGEERFPSLFNDNVMFFSSNGRIGMGGLDIYRATLHDGVWKNVTHMGYPINSPQDDYSLIVTNVSPVSGSNSLVKMEGYFSSDRFGGKGYDDVYSYSCIIPIFQKEYIYKGRSVNSETGVPIANVNINVTDLADNKSSKYRSDAKGDYEIPLKPNKKYEITMKKANYYASKKLVNTGNNINTDELQVDMKFEPIVLDKSIRLNNIYYDFNSVNLSPESKIELDNLVNILKDNKEISIELSSHTDSRGDASTNLIMSQKRAQVVVDYLVRNGIGSKRLVAKGYGKTKPLVNCANRNCSEDEHAMNRRTEFKVIYISPEMQANRK